MAAALRPDAAQRRHQPVGVVGALQIAIHLAAELPLRDRVVWIAPDIHRAAAASFHGDLPATGVGAIVRARAGDDGKRWIGVVEVDLGHRACSPVRGERNHYRHCSAFIFISGSWRRGDECTSAPFLPRCTLCTMHKEPLPAFGDFRAGIRAAAFLYLCHGCFYWLVFLLACMPG